MEDNFYANLVVTPEKKSSKKKIKDNDSLSTNTNIRSKGVFEMDDSPYIQHLSPSSKKLILKGEYHPQKNGSFHTTPVYGKNYSDGLLTTSESGIDSKKKKKRISALGKKILKNVQNSFTGRTKSHSSVAPYSGDENVNHQSQDNKPDWIDPNTKDYSKKT